MANFIVREAVEADYNKLGEIMFTAVHEGESPYTASERAAWINAPRAGDAWTARLSEQFAMLAIAPDKTPCGFMALKPDGYVDFAYILAPYRGQGLFRQLYNQIETRARKARIALLTTHASLMAAPAFTGMGFTTREKEYVTIGEESLARYFMEKAL